MRAKVAWVAVLAIVLGAATVARAAADEIKGFGEPDAEGFISIFNGQDLTNWDGKADFWSVKDGVIHGETTKEKPTRGNTFCIWRGGLIGDCEIQITFRIQNGNSGIQYRSVDCGNNVVGGYQAEVCNSPAVGFLYHERGRGSLVSVGQKVAIGEDGKKEVVGQLTEAKDHYKSYKAQDWNDYRIVCQGNHLQHFLNGVQTIDLIDKQLDDPKAEKPDLKKGRTEGIFALQIHAGAPMVVEFKDVKLKVLKK